MIQTTWREADVAPVRDALRSEPRRPYERLVDDRSTVPTDRTLELLMEQGWAFGSFARIPVTPPISWDEVASSNRSWEFHLHCWDFLSPVLLRLDAHQDDHTTLKYAVDVALDWGGTHPSPEDAAGMAWYDMAVGIRAQRLAFIADLACRSAAVSDRTVTSLLESIAAHQVALAQESIFSPHSNHGLYVAAGQLALSRRLHLLPGMEEQEIQARQRLDLMVHTQFTEEGVHKEHSPDYHRMILNTLRSLRRVGLLDPPSKPSLEDIENALAWFIVPDGSLAMFGDTPHRTISYSDAYAGEVLQYVASHGRHGFPPDSSWKSFSESGYVIIRDGWPRPDEPFNEWSYLAFNASFHSRTHKHADDLSFIWYERGRMVLIDPGRFGYLDPTDPSSDLGMRGYYYAHASRVYVEESRAHNAIEIDGGSYQRRGVTPYGSGIVGAGEFNGIHHAAGRVEHLTIDRSARILHTRLLLLRPGEWLVVLDRMEDKRSRNHQYRQWFQFAPELPVTVSDIGWHVSLGAENMWVVPFRGLTQSRVLRGLSEPQLQGWHSPVDGELTPAASVYTEGHFRGQAEMATLFSISDTAPVPLHINHNENGLEIAWRADVEHTLHISLADGELVPLGIQEFVTS